MVARLDGPVASVDHGNFNEVASSVELDTRSLGRQHLPWGEVGAQLTELREAGDGEEGPLQCEIEVAVDRRNGRVDCEELGTIRERTLDLNLGD